MRSARTCRSASNGCWNCRCNCLVQPDLLLLDEPLAGVHPVVRDTIAGIIRDQRRDRARHPADRA